MKHIGRRAAALALALLMGAAPLAAASEAMGNELQGGAVTLSQGTSLTRQIFWSDTYSDLRTERYFTYTPNPGVTPVVAYGDKVTTRATLSDMAKTLEAQGKRLVGGMNGDLYVMATGVPLGTVITDGVIRSAPSTSKDHWYLGVGFRADGTAFIGRPQLGMTATFRGLTFAVTGGINKVRLSDGLFIYTDDFGANTLNTEPGIDVILTPVLDNVGQTVEVDLTVSSGYATPPIDETQGQSGETGDGTQAVSSEDLAEDPLSTQSAEPVEAMRTTLTQSAELTVGGRVTYVVEQVLQSTGAAEIPAGKVVLSINNKGNSFWTSELGALKPGDVVNLDVTSPEPYWAQAKEAMGGLYKLVTGGKVESGLPAERTAYSAVGVKADGTAVFYTMDGKQPGHSIGATLTQIAMRLAELGCVDALSLDGGGSTTIGATYPDGGSMGVLNRPSDGRERANSVALFLETNLKPTGVLGSYQVTPSDGILLAGASVQLTAKPVDTGWYTMADESPVTWTAGSGQVDGNGLFTAGSENGVAQVTAASGAASGGAALTVVKTPDTITLMDETPGKANGVPLTALNLEPQERIDLKANAFYKKLVLTSQDACYTWTLDPAVGTVDANGVITAGTKTAGGNLTVSAGGTTLTIPVSVAGHVKTLTGFETADQTYDGGVGISAALENTSDRVRYGNHSLRVNYDTTGSGTASLTTALNIDEGEYYLNLWVYGDGTANSLTATVADRDGVTSETILTGLDFTGWNYVSVNLPANAASIRSLNLIYGGGSGQASGTFWLDQMTTSNEPIRDETPPVVTVNLNGNQLTAAVADNIDRSFAKSQLSLTWDGAPLDFTWDAASRTLKATLPADDGRLHRAAVTVTDASGNIGRSGVDRSAAAGREAVFSDMQGHWAEPYAVYLYDHKVSTGVPNEADGTLQFQPDKAITRGEFFTMAARWLNVDLNAYAGTELPFADTAAIQDWALPGVKAMYALGYLKGTVDGGAVKANPGATISRVEAMTILGRIQARGYAEAEITFSDASQVPDWALSYVKTLVSQGVVGGYENQIMPNAALKRGEVAKMLFTMT